MGQDIPEEVLKKSRKILSRHRLCNHCLGRMFREISAGSSEEVGLRIRRELGVEEAETCELCGNVFDRISGMVKAMKDSSRNFEFETFRVGSSIPQEVMEKEKKIWEEFSIRNGESIKRELNRILGKEFSRETGKKPSLDPDVLFIVDPYRMKVRLEVKPVYIYGRYRKLERGIPLTPLPGYRTSVASAVCRLVSKAFGGKCVFKSAGREDVDVRMLGRGRPFVVEVKKPRRRRVPLEELKIEGSVEVEWIGYIDAERASKILSRSHRKVYLATVYVPEGISREEAEKVCRVLRGAIVSQKTPRRVSRRRAEKVRRRKVYSASFRLIDSRRFELKITTEGGLYIKELVSGDEGRTRPSVSGILGKKAICETLDVLDIID